MRHQQTRFANEAVNQLLTLILKQWAAGQHIERNLVDRLGLGINVSARVKAHRQLIDLLLGIQIVHGEGNLNDLMPTAKIQTGCFDVDTGN